jgi:zinc transporter ZupT
LIGHALHNFLGGLAIGGIFLLDIRLGVLAWLAAAAHEVPQELEISPCSFTADGRRGRHCCTTSCRG